MNISERQKVFNEIAAEVVLMQAEERAKGSYFRDLVVKEQVDLMADVLDVLNEVAARKGLDKFDLEGDV